MTDLTRAEIDFLWNKLKDRTGLLGYGDMTSKEAFTRTLDKADCVVVYPGGLAYYTDTQEGFASTFHGAVWSSRIFRYVKNVADDVHKWMVKHSLFRMECEFPAQHGVSRFMEKIGFTFEGTRRKAWWLPPLTEPLDVSIYAIIRKEKQEENHGRERQIQERKPVYETISGSSRLSSVGHGELSVKLRSKRGFSGN